MEITFVVSVVGIYSLLLARDKILLMGTTLTCGS